jgi:hypothetical protein
MQYRGPRLSQQLDRGVRVPPALRVLRDARRKAATSIGCLQH